MESNHRSHRSQAAAIGRMSNTEFKQILGFGGANTGPIYKVLRSEIKIYMGVHNITNRTQAGDADWRELINWVINHQYTRQVRRLQQGSQDIRLLRRAAHFLCLNCCKTIHVSQGALDQVLATSSFPNTPSPLPQPSAAPATPSSTAPPITLSPVAVPTPHVPLVSPLTLSTAGRIIRIGLYDPDKGQGITTTELPTFGNGMLVSYFATLTGESYQYFHRLAVACKRHLPAGRVLEEIRGWTGSPGEQVALSNNDEVQAWLSATAHVHSPRIHAILKGLPRSRPVPVVEVETYTLNRGRPNEQQQTNGYYLRPRTTQGNASSPQLASEPGPGPEPEPEPESDSDSDSESESESESEVESLWQLL